MQNDLPNVIYTEFFTLYVYYMFIKIGIFGLFLS